MKYLFSVLLAFVFIKSYGQNSLIGTWRRISPYVKHVVMDSSQAQIGDLTIYPDSTFFIQGDTVNSGDTVPGWHVGDEHKGIWFQPDKNHLILRQQNILFLNYEITQLTNEKLILRDRMDEISHKRFYFTYRRIRKILPNSKIPSAVNPKKQIIIEENIICYNSHLSSHRL